MATENSNNYPIIDMGTIQSYYKNNMNSKHKELRVTDENFSKNTVSSVHVYRKGKKTSIVKANINVSSSLFNVEVQINEGNRKILSFKCDTCKNKSGGCKHIIALLFWLLHRNTGTIKNEQYIENEDLSLGQKNKQHARKENKIKNNRLARNSKNQLTTYTLKNKLPSLNLYTLAEYYKNQSGNIDNIEEFLNYCKYNFDEDSIEEISFSTVEQANNTQWHEMRYARITASKVFEAAYCKTLNGALFKVIMGEVIFKKKTIDKGQELEEKVLKVVEDKIKTKISRVGLYLNKDYPIFGASPDGLTSEYCIEIKCPKNKESFKKYINYNNDISTRIMAQIQMQMLFCNRKKGLFCLADPNFVYNNHVDIIEVDFDDFFIKDLMSKAQIFWENAIFPVLMQNYF